MKRKTVAIAVAALMIFGTAAAQNTTNPANTTQNDTSNQTTPNLQNETEQLDRVIITTNSNYPDSTISDSASEKLGIPILLTSPNNLQDPTANILENRNVEQAIIIGGPAVVSENVESEINNITQNDSIRLWGETAAETSIDISRFFWPENIEEVTVVQTALTAGENGYEGGHELLTAVSSATEGPILLSDTGELSNEVISELNRRDTGPVTIYSTNGTNIEEDLEEEANINAEVNEGTAEELKTEIYQDAQNNPQNRTLFAVGSSDFKYSLPTYSYPNSAIYIISEENLSEDIDYINESGYEQIMITGEENMTQKIQDRLEQTDKSTGYIEIMNSTDASAELLESTANIWINAQNQLFQNWANNFEENSEVENSIEANIELAQDTIELAESEEAEQLLDQAETNLENGNLMQTHINTFRALSAAESAEYEEQMNQTQENIGTNETTNENVTTANETEEPNTVGSSEVNITTMGNTIIGAANYTAPTTGYTQVQNVTQNGEQITFTFSLNSPNESAGQAITTYNLEDSIDVENGLYTAEILLRVDNETVNETEREINLTVEA